jgi:hypothetical protein
MIELEIQTLSEQREGLLIEVGRFVVASGFTLQRQRLVQGQHGTLMTLVVHGPARKRRALEAVLAACERIISFKILAFVEGESAPHFAASRPMAPRTLASPVTPVIEVVQIVAPVTIAVANEPEVSEPATVPVITAELDYQPELETASDFIFAASPASSPAPAPMTVAPFVELIPEGPDLVAVEKLMPKLANEYPQIFPRLLKLDDAVSEASRESSLLLAGQRTGAWIFERDYALEAKLGLYEALERIGIPALRVLVDVENQDGQVHIRNSPLCEEGGHARCAFFSGYLDGLLAPAIASDSLSIFVVCCRSYGADECVLAISD